MRVAVMVANAAMRGHLFNGNNATVGLFATDVLELDGGVADVEVLFEQVIEFEQDGVALRWRNVGDGDMTGHCARLRPDTPDMQVVHIKHALHIFHSGANLSQGDTARSAFQQDVERFADNAD